MATGTGKTLTSAAIIKLFKGNEKCVLFLVGRLELEKQTKKSFVDYLKNDYKTVIFTENVEEWRNGGMEKGENCCFNGPDIAVQ